MPHLTAVTNASNGHLPTENIMPNLCIILVQFIESTNLEEKYHIPVLLLDLPVLFL